MFPSTSSTTIPETTIEYETGTSTLEVTGTTTFSAEGITSGASQSSDEATTLHETSGPALSTIVPETSKTVNVSEKVSVIPEITPEVLYTTQLLTSIPGLSSSLPPIDVKVTEPTSFISDSTAVEEISGVPTTTHKSTTVLITSVPEDEEVTSGMIHSTFQIITEGTQTEAGSGTTEETPSTMWSSTRTTLTQSPIPVVSGVSTLTTKDVIPYTAPVTIQEPTIGYTMSHSPEITSSLSPTTLEMLTDEATTKTIFEHTRFTTDSPTREEISKSKIPPGQLEKTEPTTYATVSLTEEEISGVSPTTAEIRQVFTTSASIDKKTTIPPRFIIHSTTEEEISGVSPTIQETTSAPDIMEVTSGATPPVFHIITNEVTHFPQEKITEKSPSYLEQTESTSTMTDSATKEDISGVSPTSQETTKYMTKAPIDIKETVPPSFIIDSTTEGEISGVSTTTEETPTVLITSVLPEEVEVTSGVSLSTLQTTEGATTEASSGTTKETPSIMLYSTRTTLKDSPISIVSRVSTLATEEVSPVTVPVTTQKSTTEYKTSKSHQVTSNMFPATLESDTYESIATTIFEPTKFISVSTTEEEISGVSPIGQETTKEYFITTPDDKISDVTPSTYEAKTKIPPIDFRRTEPTTFATVSTTEEEISGVTPIMEETTQVFKSSVSVGEMKTEHTDFLIHSTTEQQISGVSPTSKETTPIYVRSTPTIMEETETPSISDFTSEGVVSGVSPTIQETTTYVTSAPLDRIVTSRVTPKITPKKTLPSTPPSTQETIAEYQASSSSQLTSIVSPTTLGEMTDGITTKMIFPSEGTTSGVSPTTEEATSTISTTQTDVSEETTSGIFSTLQEATPVSQTSGPIVTVMAETSKMVDEDEKVSVMFESRTPKAFYTTQVLTASPGSTSSLPSHDVWETEATRVGTAISPDESTSGFSPTMQEATAMFVTSIPEISSTSESASRMPPKDVRVTEPVKVSTELRTEDGISGKEPTTLGTMLLTTEHIPEFKSSSPELATSVIKTTEGKPTLQQTSTTSKAEIMDTTQQPRSTWFTTVRTMEMSSDHRMVEDQISTAMPLNDSDRFLSPTQSPSTLQTSLASSSSRLLSTLMSSTHMEQSVPSTDAPKSTLATLLTDDIQRTRLPSTQSSNITVIPRISESIDTSGPSTANVTEKGPPTTHQAFVTPSKLPPKVIMLTPPWEKANETLVRATSPTPIGKTATPIDIMTDKITQLKNITMKTMGKLFSTPPTEDSTDSTMTQETAEISPSASTEKSTMLSRILSIATSSGVTDGTMEASEIPVTISAFINTTTPLVQEATLHRTSTLTTGEKQNTSTMKLC